MGIEVRMPALSPTMEKGMLAKWLVAEGARVEPGDLLAEIETDKATMELEADEGGRIARIVVAEGTDDVAVGTVIALLGGEGEGVSELVSEEALRDVAGPVEAAPMAPSSGGSAAPGVDWPADLIASRPCLPPSLARRGEPARPSNRGSRRH